jgi:hypothetical protein
LSILLLRDNEESDDVAVSQYLPLGPKNFQILEEWGMIYSLSRNGGTRFNGWIQQVSFRTLEQGLVLGTGTAISDTFANTQRGRRRENKRQWLIIYSALKGTDSGSG